MIDPNVDLSKDREAFKKRLESRMYLPDHCKSYIQAVLLDDIKTQDQCKIEHQKQRARIGHYLDLYDAAKTSEEKWNVIGSVTASYEPIDSEILNYKFKNPL